MSRLTQTKSAPTDEEEVSKQQLRMREMERKHTFESTQTELRRQKEAIQELRRENEELRGALLQASRGASLADSTVGGPKATKTLKQRSHAIRRQIDQLQEANKQKEREIEKFREQSDEFQREGLPILTDTSPMAQKIRALEQRLDKSLIKHNEAMAIRRTYEGIVKRLREERVSFDNQLAAIEKTLKAKEHDYTELLNMAHDAQHAKEIAKADVAQFKATFREERLEKKKQLEERKAYVNTLLSRTMQHEKMAKQKAQKDEKEATQKQEEEERRRREEKQATAELRTEEEEERLQQYADAYRRIKEVTRASNVEEVVAKYVLQDDTQKSLTDLTQTIQAKIDGLHQQRSQLQSKLEEAKYSGSGHLGSRRIVDEFEAHLAEAKAQAAKSAQQYEKTAHQFVLVRSGIEHLASKLSTYHPEKAAPEMKDDAVVEVLKHCEQKLQQIIEEGMATADSLDEILAKTTVDMPQHNVRVKIVPDGDEEKRERDEERKGDGREGDDADDDPHDRLALKHMSLAAVERETKRARKRKNKKDDEP